MPRCAPNVPLRFEDQLNRVRHKEYGLGRLGVNAQAGPVVPLVFGERSFGVLFALDRLDDGVGFDPAAATTGFGVLGMRERAELQHGCFEIESAPGHGTVVRATLPLRHRADSSLPGPGGHAWRSF